MDATDSVRCSGNRLRRRRGVGASTLRFHDLGEPFEDQARRAKSEKSGEELTERTTQRSRVESEDQEGITKRKREKAKNTLDRREEADSEEDQVVTLDRVGSGEQVLLTYKEYRALVRQRTAQKRIAKMRQRGGEIKSVWRLMYFGFFALITTAFLFLRRYLRPRYAQPQLLPPTLSSSSSPSFSFSSFSLSS